MTTPDADLTPTQAAVRRLSDATELVEAALPALGEATFKRPFLPAKWRIGPAVLCLSENYYIGSPVWIASLVIHSQMDADPVRAVVKMLCAGRPCITNPEELEKVEAARLAIVATIPPGLIP